MARVALLLVVAFFCATGLGWSREKKDAPSNAPSPLSQAGLIVLYDFQEKDGAVIRDTAQSGTPINLKISRSKSVQRGNGFINITGDTEIASVKPPTRLIAALQKSGAVSLEAWLKPANNKQKGPARILSLSKNANERNFTLGQDAAKFDVRFRTTSTSTNGLPSVSSNNRSASPKLTHVVYTRERSGRARIYVNGKRQAEKQVAGRLSNWSKAFRLAIGNEFGGGRQWRGTLYRIAIYTRALTPRDVSAHFKAGHQGDIQLAARSPLIDPKAVHFENQIAPILSKNCLECHDASTAQGGLDLSHKVAAFRGGDSGRVIVPGKPDESVLWQSVKSDDMPHDRAPLRAAEKKQLKKWIADGATWSLAAIDPAIYAHENRAHQNWVRRLTIDEYIETVRAVTGVDIEDDARRVLPKDLRADGFSNTAYNLTVDLKHVESYARLAEIIVQRMDVPKFTRRFSKRRQLTDPVMRPLIAEMGQWIVRAPLEDHEVVSLRGITTTVASSGGDFDDAVGYVIEALLQSPRFLYRIENQRGDGTAWPVGDHELATRLSFAIWGGPPDKALLDAADKGQLGSPETFSHHVQRMLKDPRAVAQSLKFAGDWLNLDRLKNMRPDSKRFPNWDPALADDMRAETLAYFEEIVWNQNRPLVELLNAQVAFATPGLAAHYGLPASDGTASKNGLLRFDTTKIARGGLLTQGSVLTVGGDDASMVTRGLLVMHELLRGVVNDPPPCVDTTPVPSRPGLTQRAIAEKRLADSSCTGCHSKFEPLAFGLEKFDGLGAYHEQDEYKNSLRDDGDILFPGTASAVKYSNSTELMNLLAESDRVKESLTWKVTQYVLGRPLVASDARTVQQINQAAQKNGGTWSATLTAIVNSDLIQATQTESDD